VEVDGAPLRDVTMSGAAIWLDAHYGIDVPSAKVGEAVQLVARDDPYHPIRDYLDGLVWDGLSRLAELLPSYFGAVSEDSGHSALLAVLGERFGVGCVARVYDPGCKLDTVLVLCGAQGAGKSTAIEAIASPTWFSDTDIDPQNKDSYQQVQGVWLMELQEIDGWNNRRDQATIKKFVSSRSDRYRPPYGRCMVDQPRQCVFVGSTNEDRFLADRTGSRRYWPVLVGSIAMADIRRDRDQLWAEAVHLYRAGMPWHLTREEGDELRGASERHQQIDPWAESIDAWMTQRRLEGHGGGSLADVMTGIGLDTKARSTGAGGRVASILRALGYDSRRVRTGQRRVVEWYWPG
jgi:putative DNA primase/helicase